MPSINQGIVLMSPLWYNFCILIITKVINVNHDLFARNCIQRNLFVIKFVFHVHLSAFIRFLRG